MKLTTWIAALTLAGCGSSVHQGAATKQPVAAKPAPFSDPKLVAAVDGVAKAHAGQDSHTYLVTALRALNEDLLRLPMFAAEPAQRLRDLTEQVANAEPGSREQLVAARHALEQVELGFVTSPRQVPAQVHGPVVALADDVDALDPNRPLDQQRIVFAHALQAAADTVFLASGIAAPFDLAGRTPQHPQIKRDVALAQVRAGLASLDDASWRASPPIAGHVIAALADLTATLTPGCVDQITATRFFALRLRHEPDLEFGASLWIRDGLTSAVDVLAATVPAAQIAPVRAAVAKIEGNRSLAFEQAEVRDALKMTVDAIAAVPPSTKPATCAPGTTAGRALTTKGKTKG